MKPRMFGAVWAISGVTFILGSAVARLVPHTLDAFRGGLSPAQWVVLVVWAFAMLWGEGYRGFQKQFAPRVAARVQHLLARGRAIDIVLAPLYSVGYYGATRRRMMSSWLLTIGIIGLIIVVRQFSQPWRGIVDAGVVLGLVYGLFSVYVFAWLVLGGWATPVDPELGKAK